MKALLVNTPLHVQHDSRVLDTLSLLEGDLTKQGWEVEHCLAESGAVFKSALQRSHPAVAFCYDYRAADGEDLRAVCQWLQVPEVFSPPDLLSRFLDKQETKRFCRRLGLKVLPGVCVGPGQAVPDLPFDGPYFLKPLTGGDSRGILGDNVIDAAAQAADEALRRANRESRRYLVERFLAGPGVDELAYFFVPGRSERSWSAVIRYTYDVPPLQRGRYLSKRIKDTPRRYGLQLQNAPPSGRQAVLRAMETIHRSCPAMGVVRAEFLRQGTELFLLEINGIPGLNRCFDLTASTNQLVRDELVNEMFHGAIARVHRGTAT